MNLAAGQSERVRITMKPRMIWLVVPLLLAFLTTGCETTKGFGRDVQKLGSSIQRAVD